MTVKLVLFDWDGTLFDVIDFMVSTYREVMEEVMERMGCNLSNAYGETEAAPS